MVHGRRQFGGGCAKGREASHARCPQGASDGRPAVPNIGPFLPPRQGDDLRSNDAARWRMAADGLRVRARRTSRMGVA